VARGDAGGGVGVETDALFVIGNDGDCVGPRHLNVHLGKGAARGLAQRETWAACRHFQSFFFFF
jgi:hypothetical protein